MIAFLTWSTFSESTLIELDAFRISSLKERFDEKNIEIPFQQIVVNQPK